MGFMPFQIVGVWVRGLLSIVLLALGPYLLYQWYERAHIVQPSVAAVATTRTSDEIRTQTKLKHTRVFAIHWGVNEQTALFVVGLGMLLWALPKPPALMPRRMLLRGGSDEPRRERKGLRKLSRPDGSELCVEAHGPDDGQPIVLTHGWGLDGNEWYYAKKELAGYRLIVWDLPGLGLSTQPANHNYSLDNLASDLDSVIGVAGGRPVILMGHSIGGMITLSHCKKFPQAMGTRVCGLVLVNTTYTNPVRTTSFAELKTALQKPLLEPLLWLTIWLSPLVRVMNCLSYLNGSSHSSAASTGFAGTETRGQLDFIASYTPRVTPAVIARGMFGMLGYDATSVLPAITVPTLIVTGDRDSICTPAASQFMRGKIPAASLVEFAPAKHQGLLEHHEKLSREVAAFVPRCVSAAKLLSSPDEGQVVS